MDITHYNGQHYLTLIDHGPSRFTIWRHLRRQDSICVTQQLECVFLERGPPAEILTDNDTAFRSRVFESFAQRWGIHMRFRCAHVPSGNGITERCHRSVKRIAARKECTIQEAVYWYNVTPKDDVTPSTCPAAGIYRYEQRLPGIDPVAPPKLDQSRFANTYRVGDTVWVKPPCSRCTTQYQLGHVTQVTSEQSVEVDGLPRHVKDVRPATISDNFSQTNNSRAKPMDTFYDVTNLDFPASPHDLEENCSATSEDDGENDSYSVPRRSIRNVRPPDWYGVTLDPACNFH